MRGNLLVELTFLADLKACSRLRPSVILVRLISEQELFIGDVITSCLNDGAPPSQAELALCVEWSNLMNPSMCELNVILEAATTRG